MSTEARDRARAKRAAADRLDAERYRHLRSQFSVMSASITGNHAWVWRGNPERLRGATFDEAVDAAILEQEKKWA